MRTCKHCKWWIPRKKESWGICELAEGMDGYAAYDTQTLAWAEDVETYRATLNTHETFGCIQFDQRIALERVQDQLKQAVAELKKYSRLSSVPVRLRIARFQKEIDQLDKDIEKANFAINRRIDEDAKSNRQ